MPESEEPQMHTPFDIDPASALDSRSPNESSAPTRPNGIALFRGERLKNSAFLAAAT